MNTRWQYQTLEVKNKTWGGHDPKVIQDVLSREGLKGWELVQAINGGTMYPLLLIFKKES